MKDFERWVQQLLWDKMTNTAGKQIEIMRSKGVISLAGEDRRHIFQGVQELYDLTPTTAWGPSEMRSCRILLVGKNLEEELLRRAFLEAAKPISEQV